MSFKVYKMFYTFHVLRVYLDLNFSRKTPLGLAALLCCVESAWPLRAV